MTPFAARTTTIASDVAPVAFDCVKFVLVREGAATLTCAANVGRVGTGDVIVVAAHTSCCATPEPRVTVSTLYVDRDYLIDLVYWQCVTTFVDRLEVKHLFDTLFTNHSQRFHLGRAQLEQIAAWFDELTIISCSATREVVPWLVPSSTRSVRTILTAAAFSSAE